ncbi:MAG: phosphodiester glycosidase family protein [Bacteroidetes bacterium]|nr:phosphodiester glycosidase family protein [Bacteroidota bacterium]
MKKQSNQHVLIFFLFFILPVFSFSQQRWHKVDSLFGQLPSSIHVFRFKDSLDGKPIVAYYVSVKLKDKALAFSVQTGNGKCQPSSYYLHAEKNPFLVMNCGFYSANCRNISLLVNDGKIVAHNITSLRGIGNDSVLYYYPTRSAFGIAKNRSADVAWVFTDSSHRKVYAFEDNPVTEKGEIPVPSIYDLSNVEWKWWNMETAVGGGPTLLHDGFINITNKEEQMFVGEENKKSAKTAIGYTPDERLIMLVIQGGSPEISEGVTLMQEAILLKEIGCYEAINLNGGDNSYLLINGKETIKPSGKNGQPLLPVVFVVKHKEEF